VAALPDGAPVLLAVDYEAGFSGEMRFAAVSMVESLMARNLRLAVVSTIPAGPVLGQNLLETALSNLEKYNPQAAQAYSLSGQTINLGYLAGGATSLQEFALNPQQASRYGLAGTLSAPASWNSPALQGVGQLSDFGAVIVLTDSLETGRAWVEQVAPSLNSKPLLMVTSAQAGPLMQPYLASGQVRGMLSGMVGGTAYEQLDNLPGSGPAYWSAYQSGLISAVVILIGGALLQALAVIFSSRKAKK
jgi:hypothetical protein